MAPKRKPVASAQLTRLFLEGLFDRTRTRCRIRRRRHFPRGGGGGRRRVPDATSSPASDFLLKVDVVLGGEDARSAINASDAVRGEPFGDGCFGALNTGGTICERASGGRSGSACKVRSFRGGDGTHRRCSASCGCGLITGSLV